jgi:methyl-accepting chemotaxis protein
MATNRIPSAIARSNGKSNGKSNGNGNGHVAFAPAAAEPEHDDSFEVLFAEYEAQVAAIGKSMAVIEFNPDGTIITANDNFCGTLGYSLAEIQGKHHSLFVDESHRATSEYREFWVKLNRGEFDAGEYKRIGKGGREVWIQASYNPIKDKSGQVYKVVKYASDITRQSVQMADYSGQVAAIGKSNAVIEFNLDGTVITANDNFLAVLGYSLDEIKGRHHSMFCTEEYRNSAEYKEFWAKLNRGEFQSAEYKRIGKGGKECFIQATYNPIRDRDGRVVKVVKYATDSTALVKMRYEMELFKPMVESAKVNLMLCDLDFNIKYVNPASLATLMTIEQHLPVKARDVVGSKIDIFHKDPAHQRSMLATDKNLPHNAKIKVGPETLDLNAVAIYNSEGRYVGPMVNWSVITEQVKMADDFEASVAAIAGVVSSSSTELEASAQGVAAASEQATRNVQTVASSAEELTASIREIAGRVQEASQISQNAVRQASETTETMARLGISSQEIGQVVKVITSIAQQTNLLALNATIEAARAGEAGKGFAVVANEVKELARQTAKATEEIGSKITGVQSETASAVAAIKEIAGVINKINEISTTIAGAVEEQNAATSEISRNVGEAARGTAEVSSSISTVTQVASEGGRTAESIRGAAAGLSVESERLNSAVTNFLTRLRKV